MFKVMKGKNLHQEYSIHQGFHSDSMENSKALLNQKLY